VTKYFISNQSGYLAFNKTYYAYSLDKGNFFTIMKRNINVFMLFSFSLWVSSIHKKVINLPVIRPSIAHGCAVWFPSTISSAQNIESLQYQAGKIILKTKMSFPKSVLLPIRIWVGTN